MALKRGTHIRKAAMLWIASALLVLVSFGAVFLFVLQMRTAAIEDAQVDASNVATILSEQVEHAMEALDTSLRTTARLVDGSTPEELAETVGAPGFISGLTSELVQLHHAAIMGVTDVSGRLIAGSFGSGAKLDLSDRDYFRALRDDPKRRFIVTGPFVNRVTNEWTVFMARRLSGPDGNFIGIVFIGAPPSSLMQTSHASVSVPGQSFSLFMRSGEMLLRRPEGEFHSDVGRKIDMPAWYAAVAAGGGLYRSPGWFDPTAKFVAVRSLENFPLVVSVAISEEAALSRWRHRSKIILAGAAGAILLI